MGQSSGKKSSWAEVARIYNSRAHNEVDILHMLSKNEKIEKSVIHTALKIDSTYISLAAPGVGIPLSLGLSAMGILFAFVGDSPEPKAIELPEHLDNLPPEMQQSYCSKGDTYGREAFFLSL